MFTRLRALKVEIEHLQLLMEKAKVKLQKEFDAWWAAEAASLQVRRGALMGAAAAGRPETEEGGRLEPQRPAACSEELAPVTGPSASRSQGQKRRPGRKGGLPGPGAEPPWLCAAHSRVCAFNWRNFRKQ